METLASTRKVMREVLIAQRINQPLHESHAAKIMKLGATVLPCY